MRGAVIELRNAARNEPQNADIHLRLARIYLQIGNVPAAEAEARPDALLADGHDVRILDNLSTGHRDNAPDGAELMIGDVADRVAVRQAIAGTDGVFHLAAIASVERSIDDWV
ncbi:MAG: NAD-dependent epimerase/dehydratase family protein, partial [Stellaceae bacterium]